MEAVKDKITNGERKAIENEKIETNKKEFTICGFTITRILAYFIIYSVIGFIIETIFGLLTKGVVESRKSFLYGPFCGIYGIGACLLYTSQEQVLAIMDGVELVKMVQLLTFQAII